MAGRDGGLAGEAQALGEGGVFIQAVNIVDIGEGGVVDLDPGGAGGAQAGQQPVAPMAALSHPEGEDSRGHGGHGG